SFAQVTNPPLDSIREQLVTSLGTSIGPVGNLLRNGYVPAHHLELPFPVLDNDELDKIVHLEDEDGMSTALKVRGLYDPAGGAAALGNALAAVGDGQGAALATAIGSRAVVDLLADLGAMDAAASTVPAAAQLDRRHGVLAFALDLPGTVAALYLPIGLCDTLAPPAPTAAPLRLASRRDAVLASTTRLTATLELGDASLDAATGLRAGEILGGSRIADAVVHVRDAAGNTVFTAHLQSSDGRKALVCTHVEHQPGRT
uniref:glutamate synthase central domain-containing protein n=1 Tax=uncultured Stenotrophomonas sp. TaxID=165438 RepID=UPI0028D26C62